MREKLDKLLEKLAVNHTLAPYETQPWVHYDVDKAITCSAEVRMGPGGTDVEAEIQLLTEESDDDDTETESGGGPEQILWMRAEPVTEDQWTPKVLRIKGKDYVNEFHDWEEKGCQFFRSCVEALQMGEIPNIDTLIDENMVDDSSGGSGRRGRIGRKSPTINSANLLGMKK